MGLLKCVFPECTTHVPPDKAAVPEIGAIRQAEHKTALEPADLSRHVHCPVHATLARRNGVKMYQYLATVQELERRSREHKAVKSHFAKYAQPAASETTMQAAFRTSGAAGPNGGATAVRA
jgi:hypothetical protein